MVFARVHGPGKSLGEDVDTARNPVGYYLYAMLDSMNQLCNNYAAHDHVVVHVHPATLSVPVHGELTVESILTSFASTNENCRHVEIEKCKTEDN